MSCGRTRTNERENVNGSVRGEYEGEAVDIETGQHGSNLSVRSAKVARILSRTSERREQALR